MIRAEGVCDGRDGLGASAWLTFKTQRTGLPRGLSWLCCPADKTVAQDCLIPCWELRFEEACEGW